MHLKTRIKHKRTTRRTLPKSRNSAGPFIAAHPVAQR